MQRKDGSFAYQGIYMLAQQNDPYRNVIGGVLTKK